MRFLYPSLSGTFGAAWIAKEAGYYAAEDLDVELIRVGGSTRIVGAMVGGSGADHSRRRLRQAWPPPWRAAIGDHRLHEHQVAISFDRPSGDQAAQRSKRQASRNQRFRRDL